MVVTIKEILLVLGRDRGGGGGGGRDRYEAFRYVSI